MANSSKKTKILLTNLKLLFLFKVRTLKKSAIQLPTFKYKLTYTNLYTTLVAFSNSLLSYVQTATPRNDVIINFFNLVNTYSLWRNRPIKIGRSRKKVKKLIRRRKFKNKVMFRLKYNVRRLMIRFKKSYLWKKVKRSNKGWTGSLMPVLPLQLNKQKVLSRKAKKRRKNKKIVRLTLRKWKNKKKYNNPKRKLKSFSRQRLYMLKNSLNLHYPRFFIKKKIVRKVSSLNLTKNRQFRKLLLKKATKGGVYLNSNQFLKKYDKRRTSFFLKGKECFNRNSIKIGPVERRLLLNDLSTLDFKGFFKKVNLLPTSSYVKHPFISKKKNFRRSVFMLRFFKGIDYDIIRSNVEISKFLNLPKSKKLWNKAGPSLILKRVLLRQLKNRFKRMINNYNNGYNSLKPLNFEAELNKFKRYTMGFSKNKIIRRKIKVKHALFVSKFSNDYNYLLDKSPVKLSSSLSLLSGVGAIDAIIKLNNFNILANDINLPSYKDSFVNSVNSEDKVEFEGDFSLNKTNNTNGDFSKVNLILKNFFNRSFFNKITKSLDYSSNQKKINYNLPKLSSINEDTKLDNLATNRGALTNVSYETAKYSDLLNKTDSGELLKINRNPLIDTNQDMGDLSYFDISKALKGILSCLSNRSIKGFNKLPLKYITLVNENSFPKSAHKLDSFLSIKKITKPIYKTACTPSMVNTKYIHISALKSRLLKAKKMYILKKNLKLNLKLTFLKKKKLKSILHESKLTWRLPLRKNIKTRLIRKLDKKRLKSLAKLLLPISLKISRYKMLKLIKSKRLGNEAFTYLNKYKKKNSFEKSYSRARINRFKSMRYFKKLNKSKKLKKFNLSRPKNALRKPKLRIARCPWRNNRKKGIIKNNKLFKRTLRLMKVRAYKYRPKYSFRNTIKFNKRKKTFKLSVLSNIRVLHSLTPKNWIKRFWHDNKTKATLVKSFYFKNRSKWVSFKNKTRYFKPYYASIKYNFKKKVYINRHISKRIKLNLSLTRGKKADLGLIIKPRVKFLFNSFTKVSLSPAYLKLKDNYKLSLRKRYLTRSFNRASKPLNMVKCVKLLPTKGINKLKLLRPINLKKLPESTLLFNTLIEAIKPKLELMSYKKKNGPSKRARLSNRLRFITKSKPYKFLKKLMKFTTDVYTPLAKQRRYLNKQIAHNNVELFKKNLFIDSVYLTRGERSPYYESMALFNSKRRPTYKRAFIFKKFYFNQKSLSILKEPQFKRAQVNLIRSFDVSKKKSNSLKKNLRKKTRKTLFAHAAFNGINRSSREINFILGNTRKLKRSKKLWNSYKRKLKKNNFYKTANISGDNILNTKILKKYNRKDSLFEATLRNKLRLVRSFDGISKCSVPKSRVGKATLLNRLEKKIKEKKILTLDSLLKSKLTKVFKKNINTSNLTKYRFNRIKSVSYLTLKTASEFRYLGFKKLKRYFKSNIVKLSIKRTAAFLNERRARALKKIDNATLLSSKRIYFMYKSDSKKYKYKRKFYRPINFDNYKRYKDNIVLKNLISDVKTKRKDGSLKKDTWFFNKNKPALASLTKINTQEVPKTRKLKTGVQKLKKRIPFLSKLYRVTESIKKARMGKNYKYNPRINLYQGKAFNFKAKLLRTSEFLNNKVGQNLNTFIKMYKKSNSKLSRIAVQCLKRRIFFGLKYNPETRYSIFSKKRFLKKKRSSLTNYFKDKTPLRLDTLRNSNNLPINIGRSLRFKKLKKIWKGALKKKKDEFSSNFKKKIKLFKKIMKDRGKSVLSSSSLKKKTISFNLKLLNTNNTFKKSNWRLNLLNLKKNQCMYLSLSNLSIFNYKEFALKLFKLYTQCLKFSKLNEIFYKTSKLCIKKRYTNLNLNDYSNIIKSNIDLRLLLHKNMFCEKDTYCFRTKGLVKLNTVNLKKKLNNNLTGDYKNYFKLKKNRFLKRITSISNKYSKGYKIFLLSKFNLYSISKYENLTLNKKHRAGVSEDLSKSEVLLLNNSYFNELFYNKINTKVNIRPIRRFDLINFNKFSNKLSYLLLNNLITKPKSKTIIANKIFFNLKKLLPKQPRLANSNTIKPTSNLELRSSKYLSSILRSKKTKVKLNINTVVSTSVFFMWDLIALSITQSRLSVINLDLINFICKSKNIVRIIAKKMVGMLFFEFRNLTPTFFIREVIYLIIISIRYKDTTLLMNWLTMYMNKIGIKKHKKVIAFLRKLVRLLRKKNYFYRLGCLGFFFDIRGKVGVTGNKKKRNYVVSYGTSSSSNKNVRWSLEKNIVRTTTGVLGTTLIITY